MADWFCSVFNVVCRKRLSSPNCISELIDSAWVVIVSGQKMHNTYIRTVLDILYWVEGPKALLTSQLPDKGVPSMSLLGFSSLEMRRCRSRRRWL